MSLEEVTERSRHGRIDVRPRCSVSECNPGNAALLGWRKSSAASSTPGNSWRGPLPATDLRDLHLCPSDWQLEGSARLGETPGTPDALSPPRSAPSRFPGLFLTTEPALSPRCVDFRLPVVLSARHVVDACAAFDAYISLYPARTKSLLVHCFNHKSFHASQWFLFIKNRWIKLEKGESNDNAGSCRGGSERDHSGGSGGACRFG